MRYRYPIAPAAGWAIGIIAVLELVFLTLTEPLTGMPLFEPTVDDATVVAKRQLMERATGRFVLIGDSSCLMGLDPSVFRQSHDGEPINLGTLMSLTTAGFAAMVREVLPFKPRGVIVSILPRTLEVSKEDAENFDLVGRYLVASGTSSETYRTSIEERWSWFWHKHRFNIYPADWGGSYAAYAAHLRSSGGHFPEKGTYAGPRRGEYRTAFKPTEFSRRGLLELIAEVSRSNLPVVFWWSPSPTDAVSEAYLASATRYLDEIGKEVPQLRVARSAPAWEPSSFGSITHLTPEAARRNSSELASYIVGMRATTPTRAIQAHRSR